MTLDIRFVYSFLHPFEPAPARRPCRKTAGVFQVAAARPVRDTPPGPLVRMAFKVMLLAPLVIGAFTLRYAVLSW